MTSRELQRIVAERFDDWERILAEVHATPLIVVACGHDHARGQVHVLHPEDLPPSFDLPAWLRGAVEVIEAERRG